MAYKIITPVITEVVTYEDMVVHGHIDADGDSPPPDLGLVRSYITAARQFCENHTQRFIGEQIVEYAYDAFTCNAVALGYPVRSISAVTYVDADDVTQTADPTIYRLDDYSEPSWLTLASGASWPYAQCLANSVRIRAEVGYVPPGNSPASGVNCPQAICQAIRLLAANWYENREATAPGAQVGEVPFGVMALLQPYRLNLGV